MAVANESFVQALGYLALCIEVIAILLGVLSLYLIRKQKFTTIDMYFATILTIADLIFVLYKIIVYSVYLTVGVNVTYGNEVFNQIDGTMHVLLNATAVFCVMYLALLRCWAIFFKQGINSYYWMGSFTGLLVILTIATLVGAARKVFVLMPLGAYNYFAVNSDGLSTSLITLVILWYCLVLISVNISYPLLAYSYCLQLSNYTSELSYTNEISQKRLRLMKAKIILKVATILFVYNLCLVPNVIVNIIDISSGVPRTLELDAIAGVCLLFIPAVNAITLIFMHEKTYKELVNLVNRIFGYKDSSDTYYLNDVSSSASLK